MNRINKDIEKYLEEIKKNLVCSAAQKKTVINDLRNSIYDYVETSKVTDIEDIYSHFGQPEDIAEQIISEIEPKKVKKAFKVHKVVLAGVIAIVTTFIIILGFYIDQWKEDVDSYILEGPAVEINGDDQELPMDEIVYYKNGVIKMYTIYYENGAIKEQKYYDRDGVLEVHTIYNTNGTVKEETTYKKDGSVKNHITYQQPE